MSDDRKQDARSAWDDLRRMAEEVKVKLHLAGMEAKDRWKQLEPKLTELQQKVEAKGEKAATSVQEQLVTVADALKRFAEDLRRDLEIGRKKPEAGETPAPPDKPDPST